VWRAILGALTTPTAESINRKDAPYLVLILASLAAGLAASWQRWGNPLVDHGRELNVPLRLARGEMLYSDVGYLYGPLSPYLNTFLYRIFRPSLWVLWGHGIVSTMIILALVYWLARQIVGRFEATIACLAVTWVCALKPQGTYILAYAYSGLDGSTLVLATTALLVIFLRKRSIGWLLVAGIVASLAVLAKTEMGGAAVATGVVAAALAGFPRIRGMVLWNLAFLVPALGIPALVFAALASHVGWRTLTVENHLFFGHLPWQWLYFYGLRFGFDRPWHSLGLMLASLGRLIAFGGLLASVSFLLRRKRADLGDERGNAARNPARAVAMLLISLAGIIVTGIGLSDLGPFMAMPFLWLALAVAGIVAFVRAKREGTPSMQIQAGTMVILAASALGSLARIVLRVSTGGALSSFLLPGSIVLFVYVWLVIFPLFLPDPRTRLRAARLASIILAASVFATAVTLSVRYRRKFPYPLVTAQGTWRTSVDLGIAFDQALHFIEGKTAPGDPVAVMPEGTSLLFLSGRRNPLRDEINLPGFLDAAGEEDAIERLRRSRTAVILISNRTAREFAETTFGTDYDRRLMSWIEQNYSLCGVFGSRPDPSLQIGSPVFFIRGYCLLPSHSWEHGASPALYSH
jgi:hypothetical protein